MSAPKKPECGWEAPGGTPCQLPEGHAGRHAGDDLVREQQDNYPDEPFPGQTHEHKFGARIESIADQVEAHVAHRWTVEEQWALRCGLESAVNGRPELLAALKDLLDECDGKWDNPNTELDTSWRDACRAAEDAISKAEGR